MTDGRKDCRDKKWSFVSAEDAQRFIDEIGKQIRKQRGLPKAYVLHPYPCPCGCGRFLIGHTKREKPSEYRRRKRLKADGQPLPA